MNPYEVLGVGRDADDEEVKKAFKQQAKKTHPDVGGSPEEFHKVQRAMTVLTDPEARAHYDETGEMPDEQDSAQDDPAINMLMTLFNDILNKDIPMHLNIISLMRQSLSQHREFLTKEHIQTKTKLVRTEKLQKRLKRKKQSSFVLFEKMLDAKIKEYKKNIERSLELQEHITRAQKLLENYDFEVEPEAQAQGSGFLKVPRFNPAEGTMQNPFKGGRTW